MQQNPYNQPAAQSYPQQQNPSAKKMCIWSILAIVFAFLFAPLGIIFGIVALVKISKNINLSGKGLAIASIIIGAILIILLPVFIAILALAYFGVMNPSKFIPQSCTINPGISCDDFTATSMPNGKASVQIVIRNGIGQPITFSQIYLDINQDNQFTQGIDCETTPPPTIQDGATSSLTFTDCPTQTKDRFKAAIVGQYTQEESAINHQMLGSIVARVE